SIVQEINNTFQVKLLLNYPVEEKENIEDDVKFFQEKNTKFKDKIIQKFNFIKNIEISDLSPIIWLYFNNEDEKQKFINEIFNDEDFYQIIDLEYNPHVVKNNVLNNNDATNYYENSWNSYPTKIYKDNLNIINFNNSDIKSWYPQSKIGILEAGASNPQTKKRFYQGVIDETISKKVFKDFKISKDGDLPPSFHAGMVAGIAAGKDGVDTNAIVYSAAFWDNSKWQKQIEWMVIENNVRVINHSYGAPEHYDKEYNEQAYFLDYIARKYGVINVFSAGNNHNNSNKNANKFIDDKKISFNSIVVGALSDYSTKNNYWISSYSNRTLEDKFNDLPKPLVVAPAFFKYKNRLNNEAQGHGTSYAAPMVTGAISVLLKEKSSLNYDWKRVPAIKAILAASSKLKPNDRNLEIKSNGLSKVYGSGLIDYERMKIAADNLKTISVGREKENEYIFESHDLYLTRGENIKIASAWMNNGGILRDKENRPILNYNWWDFLNPIGLISKTIGKIPGEVKWNLEHNNEEWLKKGETEKRQNNKFFTDFDLYLEKWNGYSWEVIKSVTVVNSNVEVIDYNINETGKYRIRVKKYSNIFENSINDVLGVTYVKN
ncbi:S8 family serine peptidase, partial [[Mycoplasma] collis]|uniref:S8 family serine peptidase n=1 Tax=[Mycoplasma] collis TaxID=2127 RepID=UPI00068F379F